MAGRSPLSRLVRLVSLGLLLFAAVLAARGAGARPLPGSAAPAAVSLSAAFVSAAAGQPVTLPLAFDNGGQAIDTIYFILAYDATLLTLDAADADNDDIPDGVTLALPDGYRAFIELTTTNGEGRLQALLYNHNSAVTAIPSGDVMTLAFDVVWVPVAQPTDVFFLANPAPFFANADDEVVAGTFVDGRVNIEEIPTLTPTATITPTPSNTPTATATGTPTTTNTPAPTSTGTITAVPTATDTATAQATMTSTATAGPTRTPAPLFLPAVVYLATPTPTATATATASATPSATPSATATRPDPTATATRPTATATRPAATATPTRPPDTCVELVVNGGFESNSGWQLNNTVYPARFVTFPVHSGARALQAGIVHPPDNRYSYSSAQQTLFIPAGPPAVTLRFQLFATTTGTRAGPLAPPPVVPTSPMDRTQLADDAQMVLLFDSSGRQHVLLFQRQWYGAWREHTIDLSAFRGQAVTLYFGVFNNGVGGVTGMVVDEVGVGYCG